MYQGAILLDFHGVTADVELQLPQQGVELQFVPLQHVPMISAALPGGGRFRVDPIDSPHLANIEGAPYVVAHFRLIPPSGARADLFDLNLGALPDLAPAPDVLVSIRTDWRMSTFADDPRLVAVLRGNDRSVRVDRREGNWWRGFGEVFKLGMRHIAEGTDHLLFLLVLLFPAPLLVRHARWTGQASIRRCLLQIGKVVTAFTMGHSVTLAAGAMDVIHVPGRPIEVLIAVSILVSAVHALRPVFPGREAVIAGCFGLVHGMAFATTLAGLGLGRWDRVASIFGFNLGIEAMQLTVVAIALPSLILLSRTRLYASIRAGGAIFAGAVAIAWIGQRLWDFPNPADTFVVGLAQHAGWIATGLTLLGIVAESAPALRVPVDATILNLQAVSRPILNEQV
jgi:hypothetical protein